MKREEGRHAPAPPLSLHHSPSLPTRPEERNSCHVERLTMERLGVWCLGARSGSATRPVSSAHAASLPAAPPPTNRDRVQ